MDEEYESYGESIFEGAAGYSGVDGFNGAMGDDQAPAAAAPPPDPQTPPAGPPPAQPVQTPPPVQPPAPWGQESPMVDMMSTVLRLAGGAAIGYYASDNDEDRPKYAAMGAVAAKLGTIPLAVFAYWMAEKRGR